MVETREPGGSPGAEAMRHILLKGIAKPLGTEAEAMLFAAARDDHMVTTIRPALARGAWVLCDRFIDSTRVYQGALGNVDPRLIRELEHVVVGPDMPDLTLVLDVPPETGLARVQERGEETNRFEEENLQFHRELRAAYREIAEGEPERCLLIDASQSAGRRRRPHLDGGARAPVASAPRRTSAASGRVSEREEGDRLAGAPHPRQQTKFFGHAAAEAEILAAWNRGRLPHALLLGGPEGIGKATLAYRIARFCSRSRSSARKASPFPPIIRRAARSRLFRIPISWCCDGSRAKRARSRRAKFRSTRCGAPSSFFGSTAAMGGWRVAIVDSVDELNANGTNALLKVLEEPPPHSLFLLISHTPGRLIATIRSRCQKLSLRPLAEADVVKAVESMADEISDLPRAQIKEAAAASGGSVRRALALLLGEGLEVRGLTAEMLARLPAVDGEALHKLGDKLYGGDALYVFAETVEDWLAHAATKEGAAPARLARFAKTWENVRRAAVETDIYNLDRKPLVFQVFAMLAEATR